MRRLLAILRAARLYCRFFPYMEEADDANYWNENDSVALEFFFRTATGKKLKNRLTNYAIRSAWSAVNDPSGNNYKNGVAAGIRLTITAIENQFPAGVPTDAESEQLEGQAALDQLEHQTA